MDSKMKHIAYLLFSLTSICAFANCNFAQKNNLGKYDAIENCKTENHKTTNKSSEKTPEETIVLIEHLINKNRHTDAKKIAELLIKDQTEYAKTNKDYGFNGTLSIEQFYWAISAPSVYSEDIKQITKNEKKFKTYSTYNYWDDFISSYIRAELNPAQAIANMELKRISTCLIATKGTNEQKNSALDFWRSNSFEKQLSNNNDLLRPDKSNDNANEPNIYSWYFCNKALFLSGGTKESLNRCEEYASFSNYFNPQRLQNRDYALALYLSGHIKDADEQYKIYQQASGDNKTLEQYGEQDCYEKSTKKTSGKTITASCLIRNYDSNHLKHHPKQQVTNIKLSTHENGYKKLSVKLRQFPDWIEESLTCTGTNPLSCKLACDGGTFAVTNKNGKYLLLNKGIKIGACSNLEKLIDPSQDQETFLLEETSSAYCNPK